MLSADEWAAKSGTGFASRREIVNPAMRKALWEKCVELTGAEY